MTTPPVILFGAARAEAEKWMAAAATQARLATCLRAKCGSVVVGGGAVIGAGFNSPPAGDESQRRCRRKGELKAGFKSDATCCVHAEQRAISDALRRFPSALPGSTLYFTRVSEEGDVLRSGEPYCTICSKRALDEGVGFFALWQERGVAVWDAVSYNDASFSFPAG